MEKRKCKMCTSSSFFFLTMLICTTRVCRVGVFEWRAQIWLLLSCLNANPSRSTASVRCECDDVWYSASVCDVVMRPTWHMAHDDFVSGRISCHLNTDGRHYNLSSPLKRREMREHKQILIFVVLGHILEILTWKLVWMRSTHIDSSNHYIGLSKN